MMAITTKSSTRVNPCRGRCALFMPWSEMENRLSAAKKGTEPRAQTKRVLRWAAIRRFQNVRSMALLLSAMSREVLS